MLSKSTSKYIQSLQHKKFRDEFDVFVAEGPKLVNEFLQHKTFPCNNIYALQKWADNLKKGIRDTLGDRMIIVQDFELEKISSLNSANEVVGIFQKVTYPHPVTANKLNLVLDNIQDPGNLGTIIRIADWFGIENIFCAMHSADMYNPKVVQSTMASLCNVRIYSTDIVDLLSNSAGRKFAACLDGESPDSVAKNPEGFLVIGNESKGISDAVLDLCDEKLSIGRLGSAESLNAAVATGILLYELTKIT